MMVAVGAAACGGGNEPATERHTLRSGSGGTATLKSSLTVGVLPWDPVLDPLVDVVGNGIPPAALQSHGLHRGGLSQNRMDLEALFVIALPDASGALARTFLRYSVGCALQPNQSVSFSWIDTLGVIHNEAATGLLGLAPSWFSGPLEGSSQDWVSACLAARTNFYARHVSIELGTENLDPPGGVTYPQAEGAFWGNLFSDTPHLHACMNPARIAVSRSRYRDCAVGHVDPVTGALDPCGIIRLMGDCLGPVLGNSNNGANCTLAGNDYVAGCSGATGTTVFPRTDAVFTVYLP